MDSHLFFYVALSFMLAHEMDAVKQKEWTIFPLLSLLTDEAGYVVFTMLHIPLYGLLFWGLLQPSDKEGVIHGLAVFFVIHVGLHLLFLLHKRNPFRSFFSWSLISLAGLFALLELLAAKN